MEAAIRSCERPVRVLAGGVFKGAIWRPLMPLFREKVAEVGLFGANRDVFEQALAGRCRFFTNHPAGSRHPAFRRRQTGGHHPPVPGHGSFDLYPSYKARVLISSKFSPISPSPPGKRRGQGMSRAISVGRETQQPQGSFDLWLLGSAMPPGRLGAGHGFSASGVMAERMVGNRYYFFQRQALFALVSLAIMGIFAWMPRRLLHGQVYLWLFGIIGLLVLTLVPPFSVKAGGARRWMHFGPVTLQPLELAKVVLVFYLAYFFSQKQKMVGPFPWDLSRRSW